jgi:hypothetical protein
MSTDTPRPQATAWQRKEALSRVIRTQVVQGARIESQNDYDAVLVKGHRVNHLLHFVIGLITFGVWWLAWIVIAIVGGEKRFLASVDEYGETLLQRL